MLDHPSDVMRALIRVMDIFDPVTGSLVMVGKSRGSHWHDPFRGGFIAGIEERAELLRRLRTLDPRKRAVLCYWYLSSLPVTEIAKEVGVSRMHCYRLRNQALRQMTEESPVEDRHGPSDRSPGAGSTNVA